MKLQRTVYQTKKQVKTLNTEIISTQHCIKVNEEYLEVIYLFSEATLQVHLDNEMIYSRKFDPSRIVLSYLNVVDVTIEIYLQHKKKVATRQRELEQEQEEQG